MEQMPNYRGLTDPAQLDRLTGLPDRSALLGTIKQALCADRPPGCDLALLSVRLNHACTSDGPLGDSLVAAAAERLIGCVRLDDIVLRQAHNEFAIVLDPIGSPEVAGSIAAKICSVFTRGFNIGGQRQHIGVSVGIGVFPRDALSARELMSRAERALDRACRYGDCFLFHDDELNQGRERLHELRDDPRSGLDNHEFYLDYQPLYSLRSEQISGAEALVRWRHPQRGTVLPDAFIPVIETSGLIHELGHWVMEQACTEAAGWHRRGLPLETISVNVSGRQIERPDLPERVARVLQQTGLPAQRLQLELTESSLMHRPQQAARCMSEIRDMGVGLALDDFGSGYSALAHLLEFPLDTIKIDRGFIARVDYNASDRVLVSGVISLARELGLRVVAEGVETERQLDFLRQTDCDEVQGFLLGRPTDPTSLACNVPMSVAAMAQAPRMRGYCPPG
jgi:diguanylate cyclase (GGDEF)-like protein